MKRKDALEKMLARVEEKPHIKKWEVQQIVGPSKYLYFCSSFMFRGMGATGPEAYYNWRRQKDKFKKVWEDNKI